MKKRSVRVSGHPTSITLEDEFWVELQAIAQKKSLSINTLISEIDSEHEGNNLSSALRIFILNDLKKQIH